jgi:oligopeptide transport system permease protein
MGRYVRPLSYRLFQFVISLFTLIFLTFWLLRFFPGSPFNDERNLDPQILSQLREFYGLNQSLGEQFWTYLQRIFSGDLGSSMHFVGRSVHSLIWEYGRTSVFLGICAFALALAGSFLYLAATRLSNHRRKAGDLSLIILMSVPTLALGPLCIWLFAFELQWLPVALLENKMSYVLPILLLSLKPMISLARVLSSSVDLTMNENYIQTARAMGHPEHKIVLRFALRNSLTSFLSQSGPLFASLISGSFLIEVLFAIPGLGSQFVESVLNRDWPLILGLTLAYGFILLFTQLLTDFLILLVDPRVETL